MNTSDYSLKVTLFQKKVYAATRRIPSGRVSTYAEIAKAIGQPGACRAVGNALHNNPFAPEVPCHRVVKSDGSMGGFASGYRRKIEVLSTENITVTDGRIDNFQKKIFIFHPVCVNNH